MSMLIDAYRFGGGGGGGLSTWDAGYLSPAAVLSLGNIRLTANTGAGGTYASTRSVKALTGLAYVSCAVSQDSAGGIYGVGIADSTLDYTNGSNWIGHAAGSVGAWGPSSDVFTSGGSIGTVGTMPNPVGSLEFAVRVGSRRVWIRQNGGAWVGGGDPAADTSPTTTLSGSGALYMVGTLTKNTATAARYAEIDIDAAATTGTPPAGFTAGGWAP